MTQNPTITREDVRTVATYHKGVLFCIVVYFVLVVITIGLWNDENMLLFMSLVFVTLGIIATMFVFPVATTIYGTWLGILLVFLVFVPVVGLVVLIVLKEKATIFLQSQGIPVGLLGASKADVESVVVHWPEPEREPSIEKGSKPSSPSPKE